MSRLQNAVLFVNVQDHQSIHADERFVFLKVGVDRASKSWIDFQVLHAVAIIVNEPILYSPDLADCLDGGSGNFLFVDYHIAPMILRASRLLSATTT